jgi:uncharacterized radical SAM superfamily Fe-S cluster-containing enzyme
MALEVLRKTISVCPECLKQIPAQIVVEKNMVLMKKTCEKHGEFMDKLSDDVDFYKWTNSYVYQFGCRVDDTAPTNIEKAKTSKNCPLDCGMCEKHKSAPNFMICDITNRCNLNCPICFANSNKQGRIVEYSYEQVVRIMEHFAKQRPYQAALAQFSGGEPTLHPRILDIVKAAKDIGFPHRMINTNGIRIAKDKSFLQALKDVDCGAIYLSFDGLMPETYKKIRGLDLTKIKQKVIQNCREVGYEGVMLVVTVCKGINDMEVGNILNFGRDNNDVVAGIVFQPVSLCGRVATEELMNLRYTNTDLVREIERHTGGQIRKRDFYPLAMSNKLTQMLAWFSDIPQWSITAHDDCGLATLVQIGPNKEWNNLEHYADVEGLVKWTNEVWDMVKKREIPKPSSLLTPLKALVEGVGLDSVVDAMGMFSDKMTDITYRNAVKTYWAAGALKYVRSADMKVLTSDRFYNNMLRLVLHPQLRTTKAMLMNGTFFIGSMHFQDAYNFDTARVERCVVHYGVLDPADPNKVLEIPFCTFNTIHRERIEREWAAKYAKPLDITPEQNAKIVQELSEQIAREGPATKR